MEMEHFDGRRGGDGGEQQQLHVAMLPFLAFGHIAPFVHLSKKLAAEGVKVSFLSAPANIPRITSLLSPTCSTVDVVPLHLPHVDGLPPEIQSTAEGTPDMAELLKLSLDLTGPQVASFLSQRRPHAIFHDFNYQWLPSVAHPLGVKTLFFSVVGALTVAFFGSPSRGTAHYSLDDLRSPPPGFPSSPATTVGAIPLYQAAGYSYINQSFYGMPSVYDRLTTCMRESSAVVFKTCREMEGPFVEYLEGGLERPILLAGPVVPDPPAGELEQRWAGWLAGFSGGSVVYCSFGSETFLTDEGIVELALGLELTGLPFLLVLNFPRGGSGEEDEEEKAGDAMGKLRRKLPEGFEERVRGRGAVHSGWVQQQLILAHPSVGCFLCHAGLSSVVEGLLNGCHLVLLPQKGDQFQNATLLAGDLRAAVEVPRREHDGWFAREDVRDSVRKAMVEPGASTVRENARRWGEFLLDEAAQRRFTTELVEKLWEMADLGKSGT